MSCKRGKANPDAHTRQKLFAASGGYCQNPACNIYLFIAIGPSEFHIAEMAHIISAGDSGPRADRKISKELKGDFENLILLCPTCHTKIDKAEAEFPDSLIKRWKSDHGNKIEAIFNIKQFATRSEVRTAVLPMLNENRTIFENYGPLTESRFNPESEMPKTWISKVHQNILPNNRKILALLDRNSALLTADETKTVNLYRQHVQDFEARHINNQELNGLQYPIKLNQIFID